MSSVVLELSQMDGELRAMQAMALLQTLGINCRILAASPAGSLPAGLDRALFANGIITELAGRPVPCPSPARGGLAPWQVRRVTAFIDAHFTRQIAIFELAALVSLSPFHFARAFRASVGITPGRYQAERRIARARMLLIETDRPITEIALDLGFADASYLSRLLKRWLGLTATQIRRER